MTDSDVGGLAFDRHELLPAVVQDARDGRVLMLGYMNREAWAATRASGEVHFFSRSRRMLWRKGETSGHRLRLRGLAADCDGDAVLVAAEPAGPTCHTGEASCFHRRLEGELFSPGVALGELLERLRGRLNERPAGSYTVALADDVDRLGRKVVEEATEVLLALKNGDHGNLVWELADLIYHLCVVLVAHGVSAAELNQELARRAGRERR